MKIKNSLLVFILVLFIPNSSSAQVRFGLRAGLNLANVSGGGLEIAGIGFITATPKMIKSFHLGGIVEFSLPHSFYIETGIFASGKGTNLEASFTSGIFSISEKTKYTPLYLEIPINAIYKVKAGSAKLQLFAGPYFAYGVGGKKATEYTSTGLPAGITLTTLGLDNTTSKIQYGSDLKAIDFGLNFGVGVEIKNFLIRIQHGLGFSNIEPSGNSVSAMKNGVTGIGVGYLFDVKKKMPKPAKK